MGVADSQLLQSITGSQVSVGTQTVAGSGPSQHFIRIPFKAVSSPKKINS